MNPEEWYFLVDKNLDPRVVELLENEGYRADKVGDNVLSEGSDDASDVLPFAVDRGMDDKSDKRVRASGQLRRLVQAGAVR